MSDALLMTEHSPNRPIRMPGAKGKSSATTWVACGHTLPRNLGCGIGLKAQHADELLATRPELGFLEIHAENYMVDGGPFHRHLTRLRAHYALSIHGVGLSIGAETPPDKAHLARLAILLDRYQPESFSEHLAWSTHHGQFLNDLLPLVYNAASLQRVCDHIDQVQSTLKRRMLLENPSTYVSFKASDLRETDFISEIVRRTGCGLLLDVNNVHVSCTNHRWDSRAYLNQLPLQHVHEIHLAGFTDHSTPDDQLLIDSHDQPVDDAVWSLYQHTLQLTGPVATLIERDGNLPTLDILLAEAHTAAAMMKACPLPNATYATIANIIMAEPSCIA